MKNLKLILIGLFFFLALGIAGHYDREAERLEQSTFNCQSEAIYCHSK